MADSEPEFRRVRQPQVFWLALIFAAAGAAFFAVRVVLMEAERSGPLLLGAVIGLALVALIVGGFVLDNVVRKRNARAKLPTALLIAVPVGGDLSTATSRLARLKDDESIRLRNSSYAAIAVDGSGVRFIGKGTDRWAVIPASDVSVAGFSHTMVGARSMQAIVLRVIAEGQSTDIPIVPMRLRGNPLSALRQSEMDGLVDAIEAALNGGSGQDWKL